MSTETTPARRVREPSIRLHKSGLYEVRWRPDPFTRKSLYRRTHDEAKLAAAQVMLDEHAGIPQPTRRYTLASWLPHWLESAPNLSRRTRKRYDVEVRKWVEDRRISHPYKLAQLTPDLIRQALRRQEVAGHTTTSQKNALAVLRLALDAAHDSGHIGRNVARMVRAPRPVVRPITMPHGAERERLVAAMADDDLEALWMIALYAGLRQGEVLALRWCDVNTDTAQINVRAQIENGTTERVDTKTRKHRIVHIDGARMGVDLVGVIERHRDRAIERGLLPTGTAFMFTLEPPAPIMARTLYERWVRLCLRARVGEYRFHDLRHAAATDMLTRLDVATVSRQLGHSSLAITNRYLHPEQTAPRWEEPTAYPRSRRRAAPFTPDPYPQTVSG